jgi:hypothetical protein
MRHLLLLSVLLCASWAIAQNSPSQTNSTQSTPTQAATGDTGSQTTVQGCLSGSDGNYTLTDKNGNSFQLKGDTAKLSEHVGHEIKITGALNSASASSGGGSNTMGQTGTASQQQTIEVSSMKHVAKTCTK